MADTDISSMPPPPPPLPDLTPQPSPKKEEPKKTAQSQTTPKKEEPKNTSQHHPKTQNYNERPHQPSTTGSTGESGGEDGHSKEENDFLHPSDFDSEAIKSAVRRVSIAFLSVLGIDLNSYATKKSLAQGILDLALLAANASQLKFILTVGKTHEFYDIILWLVVSSIILQAVQAVVCVVLALVLNLNNVDEQKKANIVNNVGLSIVILIVIVNVVICGFDIKSSNYYFFMIKQNISQ